MEYRENILEYFQHHHIKPKPREIRFSGPFISAHLEYELQYLMYPLDSEYMLDWVPLLYASNVPVPVPLSKRLSPMEKEFRLQLLYSALLPREGTKKTESSSFTMMVFFAIIGLLLWYNYSNWMSMYFVGDGYGCESKSSTYWWIIIGVIVLFVF